MGIKYAYARDIDGKLVYIDESIQGKVYYCPQCGNEMIPKMGEINTHHFAHKIECSCNGESYLHRVAKEVFKKIYDTSSEFILEYRKPIICPSRFDLDLCKFASNDCIFDVITSEIHRIDLKSYFDQCLIEASINNDQFVADIMLRNSSGQHNWILLIEFYHTHKCSIEKIGSGYHIIEIRIDNEDEIIDSNRIGLSDRVTLYGFKPIISRSKGLELYVVSFGDESYASDLHLRKLNCVDVFKKNYNDCYECSDAFVVAIDPFSYNIFSLNKVFKTPPSIGEVACAIAYSKGFRTFENCDTCVHSRRSQFNIEKLWCSECNNDPSLSKNPKNIETCMCRHFLPNINRIKYIARYIQNLKFEVLRCELPLELDDENT